MKIYFAGERDLRGNDFMNLIYIRLMSFFYHFKDGKSSQDLQDWFIRKKNCNSK